MPLLYPELLRNRITDITLEDLRALGVKGLLLDVDNTLALHGSQVLDPAVEDWLQKIRKAGIRLTVGVQRASPQGGSLCGAHWPTPRGLFLQAVSAGLLERRPPSCPAAEGMRYRG